MTWPGARVVPVPAGAGRADPYTEHDAYLLRVLLGLEAALGDDPRMLRVARRAYLGDQKSLSR